jgi:methylmalonyl-CoA mutase, N-terminal domain
VRARRDGVKAQAALAAVRRACQTDENLFPPILEAVQGDVTLGEICQIFREVFGEHRDPAYL